MENSYAWKVGSEYNSSLSKHSNSPSVRESLRPQLSYMLLCELLKMDIYQQNDPDQLAVMDMMDERNDLDSLFLNSDRQDVCGLDPKMDATSALPELDAMDTGLSQTDTVGEFEWIQELQNAAIAQLHQLGETENTDPNLLVNPQTVTPVCLSQPSHTQVRDAMLTDNNLSLNLTNGSLTITTSNQIHASQSGLFDRPAESPSKNMLSPSESSPVLVGHLQNGIRPRSHITVSLPPPPGQSVNIVHAKRDDTPAVKVFPKPVYSYSCLIALALKNSQNGSLPVSEIYNFMTENFPYFKTAPDGWKNSVRHNLSLNKCFEKVENPKLSSNAKKGCLWALNPAKKCKMEEEIAKGSKKDPAALRCSMAFPERLEKIERGEAGLTSERPCRTQSQSSEPQSPIKVEPPVVVTPSTPTTKRDDVFTSELRDLHVLDSNFSLDPTLGDLAMQHDLWDEDLANDLNIDLVPHVTMATIGSPMGLKVSTSSSDMFDGNVIHGTYVYASSPVSDFRCQSPVSLTATLLSLATPPRTLSTIAHN